MFYLAACRGNNANGQLGSNETVMSTTPVPLSRKYGFASLAAGAHLESLTVSHCLAAFPQIDLSQNYSDYLHLRRRTALTLWLQSTDSCWPPTAGAMFTCGNMLGRFNFGTNCWWDLPAC